MLTKNKKTKEETIYNERGSVMTTYNLLIKLDSKEERDNLLSFLDKHKLNKSNEIRKDNVFFQDEKTKREIIIT